MTAPGFVLAGKVALVTGGASGIGAGICAALAEAGATILVADIAQELAEARAEALRQHGHRATALRLDLADEDSIRRGCAEAVDRHGAPWILVNNAGLQDRQMLLDGTADFWDLMLSVNARGPYLMSREIGRVMVEAGQGGRIIHVASAALIGQLVKGHAAYASSKAALLGLMRASALDLVEHGITVNTVLPGGVATPGARGAQGPAPQGPGTRRPPLGMCEPRDIGDAVLFFASPGAQRITNQTLAVDAGWSLT